MIAQKMMRRDLDRRAGLADVLRKGSPEDCAWIDWEPNNIKKTFARTGPCAIQRRNGGFIFRR